MYFEIYKQGKLIKRGDRCLNEIEWTNEIMSVPEMELVLPAEYAIHFDGREDVIVHINQHVFWGHVKRNYELNKEEETLTLPLDHVVCEWEYRQISVNHAINDGNISVVYKGAKVKKSNDEGITASDFLIRAKRVSKATDADLIRLAQAQGWSLINGDPIPVTKVDRSELKAKDGTYKVTFSTKQGTSVTVNAEVSPTLVRGGVRYKSNRTAKEKIQARRFAIDVSEADNLTKSEVINFAQAKAWKLYHPDQSVPFTSVTWDIKPVTGTYTVTFQTAHVTLSIDASVEVMAGATDSLSPSVVDTLGDIYSDLNMAYEGWAIDWQDDSEDRLIDYVYSKQNKLEALTKTMELTPDLFWRVGFTGEKLVEIGKFGKHMPCMISTQPSSQTNRRIITEPTVTPDYENVINVATVYADKSDGGMSSLTLRDIYENPKYQIDGFPVVILRANVNNERDYTKYIKAFPELAPNNELEYAVLDEESIALESGILIEGSYTFNDLGSFNTESKRITNEKRLRAAKTVYQAAIRKLKQARRNYRFTCTVEGLPPEINVGDMIRVMYDNSIWNLDACSNYWKKILQLSDWFYIESITRRFDMVGGEVDDLTLVKYLKVERETDNQ